MAGGTRFLDVLTNVVGAALVVLTPAQATWGMNADDAADQTLTIEATNTGAGAADLVLQADRNVRVISEGPNTGWAHSALADGDDLTISLSGAFDASVVIESTGTGADALSLSASAGSIAIDGDQGVAIESANGPVDIATDNVAQNVNIGTDGGRTIQIGHGTANGLTMDAGQAAYDLDSDVSSVIRVSGTDAGTLSLTLGVANAGAGDARLLVEADLLQADGDITTAAGVTSGTKRLVGGRAFGDSAESTAISNAEAVFDTLPYSIPAETLKIGTRIEFEAFIGVIAVTGTPTAQIRVRIGGLVGTLIFEFPANTVAVNDVIVLRGTITARTDCTAGAGDLVGSCTLFSGAGIAANMSEYQLDLAGSVAGTWVVSVDNSGPLDLVITGQTDAAGTQLQLNDVNIHMVG